MTPATALLSEFFMEMGRVSPGARNSSMASVGSSPFLAAGVPPPQEPAAASDPQAEGKAYAAHAQPDEGKRSKAKVTARLKVGPQEVTVEVAGQNVTWGRDERKEVPHGTARKKRDISSE